MACPGWKSWLLVESGVEPKSLYPQSRTRFVFIMLYHVGTYVVPFEEVSLSPTLAIETVLLTIYMNPLSKFLILGCKLLWFY